MEETIREYCELHRKQDDLESLYFALYCQFGLGTFDERWADQPIPPEMKRLLESFPE
jgi:hypothetical protein